MKLTTAFIIGVFTVGSGYTLADHRHENGYWNQEHHQAANHHRKALKHKRKAYRHEKIARRHERAARKEYRDHYRDTSHRDSHYRSSRYRNRDYQEIEYGRVINVEPVYRSRSVPVSDDSCIDYDNSRPRHNSYTATVLGAVIGGALGHRIGDAHGDADVAAVAGGLLGASVGHNLDRRAAYNRHVRVEGPCRVKQRYETHRELVEYKVSYRYNGEVHRTRMDYDPGKWVKLDVEVSPA